MSFAETFVTALHLAVWAGVIAAGQFYMGTLRRRA